VRLALALVIALTACTQPRSARCKQVCSSEADCVARTSSAIPFDEKECVAACAVLEADQENLAKVEKHAECVAKNQGTCQAMLDCP
jgi:hypothetical protein